VGLLLATGVFGLFTHLSEDAFLSWGWRIPFLFGIVLTGLGYFIRLRVIESPVFERAQATPDVRLPIVAVLRDHKRNVLLAMGARAAENAFFYIFTIWVLSYAMQYLGVAKGVLLNGVLLGSAVQLVSIPFFGALSDRIGRKPIYLGGTLFLALFCQPFFWMVQTRESYWIWAAIVLGMIGHSALYGPQAAFFTELFGTRTRYTGASLGYQLAAPFAGGLAPLIASWLLELSGGATWPILIYLGVLCGITVTSVMLAAETNRHDLSSNPGPKEA
jgi:MFS family permease